MDTTIRFYPYSNRLLHLIIAGLCIFFIVNLEHAWSQSQTELLQIAKTNADKSARKTAVKKLDAKLYQPELAAIFLNDPDAEVCQEAFNQLSDQNLLADIAMHSDDPTKSAIVVWKINKQHLLLNIAQHASEWTTRDVAIERLDVGIQHNIAINDTLRLSYALKTDTVQQVLFDIAQNDSFMALRHQAKTKLKALFENLTDQQRLMNVILTCEFPELRQSAMKNLIDQNLLAQLAQQHIDQTIRSMAVWKLTDRETLKSIAKKDKVENIRLDAKWRLDQLKHQK